MALHPWTRVWAAGRRNGIARLRAAVVSPGVFCALERLLGLLLGFAQLVEVLAEGRIPLHALADDMMALALVMG